MLQGYKALVKAQSSATAFTDEAMSTSDDQTYTIVDSGKDVWTLDAIIVKEDASPTTESYTIQRLANGGATVTFATIDAGRGTITTSGNYVTLVTVSKAKDFAFNGTTEVQDSTPFNQDNFRTFDPTLNSATADLSRFFETDDFFIDELLNKEIKVIELYPAFDGEPIRFFALLTSDTIDTTVDSLINESLSYQVTNEYNYGI